MSTTIHENPVVYTELHSPDPNRAGAFYGELFGWKPETSQTPMGPYTMFTGQLAGMKANEGGITPTWVPYVGVPDVRAATQRAQRLGATVLRDCTTIPDGTFSVVRDPTGAVVGLFQKAATLP